MNDFDPGPLLTYGYEEGEDRVRSLMDVFESLMGVNITLIQAQSPKTDCKNNIYVNFHDTMAYCHGMHEVTHWYFGSDPQVTSAYLSQYSSNLAGKLSGSLAAEGIRTLNSMLSELFPLVVNILEDRRVIELGKRIYIGTGTALEQELVGSIRSNVDKMIKGDLDDYYAMTTMNKLVFLYTLMGYYDRPTIVKVIAKFQTSDFSFNAATIIGKALDDVIGTDFNYAVSSSVILMEELAIIASSTIKMKGLRYRITLMSNGGASLRKPSRIVRGIELIVGTDSAPPKDLAGGGVSADGQRNKVLNKSQRNSVKDINSTTDALRKDKIGQKPAAGGTPAVKKPDGSKVKSAKDKGTDKMDAKVSDAYLKLAEKGREMSGMTSQADENPTDKMFKDVTDIAQGAAVPRLECVIGGGSLMNPTGRSDEVRSKLASIRGARKRKLCEDGDDIDIQALIQAKLGGVLGSTNIFIKERRDSGIDLLVVADCSGSMRGNVKYLNSGVSDIVAATEDINVNVELWGFNTTMYVFDKPCDLTNYVGGLTDMLPVLEASMMWALAPSSRRRAVILITDGSPTSVRGTVTTGDPREDLRVLVKEIRDNDVMFSVLAVDMSKDDCDGMYGREGYGLIKGEELGDALVDTVGSIVEQHLRRSFS